MKRTILTSLLACCMLLNANGQKDARANLMFATFSTPGKGPYVETYLSFVGSRLVASRNANKKYQASVEVSMAFKLKEEIRSARKYVVMGPEVDDTAKITLPNFIDQQRTPLPNGDYVLEITITDKNNPAARSFSGSQAITVNFPDDKVSISDIELLESYTRAYNQGPLTKSGYDLVPYVANYFPENMKKLAFYTEVYNTKQVLGTDEKFVIEYYVESFENKAKINNLSSFNRQTTGPVNVLLSEFSVAELPSGNYNLVVEIKDKTNTSIAVKKAFFQRRNPNLQMKLEDIAAVATGASFVSRMNNADSLYDFIRSLRPISSQMEINFAENRLKDKNIDMMQKYFLNFWQTRNQTEPEKAWLAYYAEVLSVQKSFGTKTLKGYDTDRGRVYLQYGKPDHMTKVDNEPSAYPYEIWQYYKLKGQTNRKFVFCNPDLVTNNYRLIHSDAIGELNDPRWNMIIHNRDSQSQDFENLNAPSHYGGSSLDNFNNPR